MLLLSRRLVRAVSLWVAVAVGLVVLVASPASSGILYGTGDDSANGSNTIAPLDLTTGVWDPNLGVSITQYGNDFSFRQLVSVGGILYGTGDDSADGSNTIAPLDLTTGVWDPNLGVSITQYGNDFSFRQLVSVEPIPEPTTALLLTLGLAGLGMRRRH